MGAPKEICNALEPIILDFSYFVSGKVNGVGSSSFSARVSIFGLVLFFIFAGVDESSSLSFSWLRNF
jgi:hypothetical protein